MNRNQINALLDLLADGEHQPLIGAPDSAFPFTGNVLIRTVTHYHVGRVERIVGGFVVLGEAAWIADTGRFSEALVSGKLGEVEPFPGECAVSLGAIVDVAPWPHDLQRAVK